ncbi:MAG: hypothetical protein V1663_01695 [archaeon]
MKKIAAIAFATFIIITGCVTTKTQQTIGKPYSAIETHSDPVGNTMAVMDLNGDGDCNCVVLFDRFGRIANVYSCKDGKENMEKVKKVIEEYKKSLRRQNGS